MEENAEFVKLWSPLIYNHSLNWAYHQIRNLNEYSTRAGSWLPSCIIYIDSMFAFSSHSSFCYRVHGSYGRPQKFFHRGQRQHFANLLRLMTMQCRCTFTKSFTLTTRLYHKETAPRYNSGHKKCTSLAAIARYIPKIFTIGYLKIFKAGYLFSQKYCHGL